MQPVKSPKLTAQQYAHLDRIREIKARYEDRRPLVGSDARYIYMVLRNHPRAKQKVGVGVRAIFGCRVRLRTRLSTQPISAGYARSPLASAGGVSCCPQNSYLPSALRTVIRVTPVSRAISDSLVVLAACRMPA
jgi:hypothetical protein